ncbi:MAG: hypothetical protein K9L28_03395, partial [Synergistales bacterium]|nr:hypothetical protein [Synergistales bacterium]
VVETGAGTVLLDPGIALGYRRYGLLPHPAQVGVCERRRERIVEAFRQAAHVVFSHFHGDHVPLSDANPFQLHIQTVGALLAGPTVWMCSAPGGLSDRSLFRRNVILQRAPHARSAVGIAEGVFRFSPPVPYGEPDSRTGSVVMTALRTEAGIFVHASDIQFLSDEALAELLALEPEAVLASGPPLYLDVLNREARAGAWRRLQRVAAGVPLLILDHHLLRSREGAQWVERLDAQAWGRVVTAAAFMGKPLQQLEARRKMLYRDIPVPPGWHEAYAAGAEETGPYFEEARRRYPWFV